MVGGGLLRSGRLKSFLEAIVIVIGFDDGLVKDQLRGVGFGDARVRNGDGMAAHQLAAACSTLGQREARLHKPSYYLSLFNL